MSQPKETYRHRNSKSHWTAKDNIHTFWVGQRVVRSSGRKNYIDQVDEVGVVESLPLGKDGNLMVRIEGSRALRPWSPTECVPYLVLLARNAKRLRSVARDISDTAKRLDENGLALQEDGA